jgi:hypothetical protein
MVTLIVKYKLIAINGCCLSRLLTALTQCSCESWHFVSVNNCRRRALGSTEYRIGKFLLAQGFSLEADPNVY